MTLVEDSDTGSSSSVIVRKEYLFALQFWCCELSGVKSMKKRQEALLLIFVIWGCFDRRWVRVREAWQKVSLAFSFLMLLSPRFCPAVLVWIKIIKREGESKIPLCNPSGGKILLRASASYNKLLGRAAFRILPDFHDGVPLRKQPASLRHWLFPQKATTADVKLIPNPPPFAKAM